MLYRLYKLRFLTPVRFGVENRGAGLDQASLAGHADTLFSAFVSEAAAYGEKAAKQLIDAAQAGNMLLSDLFPYQGDRLYLPRPLLPPRFDMQNQEQTPAEIRQGASRRKLWKQQKYLAVSEFPAYLRWLETGSVFDGQPAQFGAYVTADKVNRREKEDALPYLVASYTFLSDMHEQPGSQRSDENGQEEGSGLYFILGTTSSALTDRIDDLIASLGYSGIGGKRSSGYGKFELYEDPIDMDEQGVYEDDAALYAMLTAAQADWQMTMSVLWPTEEEVPHLKDAYYQLIQRSGFVNSPSYAPQAMKRHGIHMINSGSCLRTRAAGQIGDLSAQGAHPVYRYGKPLYAGVNL